VGIEIVPTFITTVQPVVNKNHGEISPRENTRWEEGEMCCVFKFSRPVQENSGGVLTVKLDYVDFNALKNARNIIFL
jgi:hypothetical protein